LNSSFGFYYFCSTRLQRIFWFVLYSSVRRTFRPHFPSRICNFLTVILYYHRFWPKTCYLLITQLECDYIKISDHYCKFKGSLHMLLPSYCLYFIYFLAICSMKSIKTLGTELFTYFVHLSQRPSQVAVKEGRADTVLYRSPSLPPQNITYG
jgi:hypothetical protein